MTGTSASQEIAALLERATAESVRLKEALASERDALHRRDPDALSEATATKQALFTDFERTGRALLAAIDEQGPPPKDTDGIGAAWDRFRTLLDECRHMNRVNGGIIAISQRHTERLLDVLRGDLPDNKLYNATGRSQPLGGPRPIARA